MTIKSGIYCIVHKASGKRYVGSAKDILERCRTHRYHLNRRKHHASKLQRAWDKYGPDAFLFRVLERVPCLDDLLAREQFWIDAYKSASEKGYNSLAIAGSPRGFVMSEDQKAKLRKANLGKKRDADKVRRGFTYSEASRAKMRAAKLGVPRKPFTPETIERMKAAQARRPYELRHKPMSEETKARMSEAQNKAKLTRKSQAKHAPKWIESGDFGL